MHREGSIRRAADRLPPAAGRGAAPTARNAPRPPAAPIAAVIELPENTIARSAARVTVRRVMPEAMSVRGL